MLSRHKLLYLRNILIVEVVFVVFLTFNLHYIIQTEIEFKYYVAPFIISLFFGYLYTKIQILKEQFAREKVKSEEASRLKSAFLSNMSHEIRTPLHTIFGSIDLAISELDTNREKGLSYLHIAKESSTTLLQIINNILDLSKIEAGQMETRNEIVDLRKLLATIYDNSKVLIYKYAKDLELKIDISDDISNSIITDETKLNEILTNLVTNAIKFTEKGSITVECKKTDGNFLEFSITDTGKGIPEASMDKIFNMFHQLDNHLENKTAGTGLGLAISRDFTVLLGGKLDVESHTGENSWTRFHFTIKYTPTDKQPLAAKPDKTDISNTENMSILLVEDNILNQKICKKLLEKNNIRVCTANDGKEAVNKFKTGSFDLILMDLQMPVMDGFEATKSIRTIEKEEDSNKTFIIALTADANRETIDKCYTNGFDYYFSKPLDFEALKKYIQLKSHKNESSSTDFEI